MVDNTMELAQLLNQYQAHSVQLVSHVHDNVPTIVLIDTHVQRLLMNLLTNAIYHTARGTVQVELSIGDADDPPTKPECDVNPLLPEQNQVNLEFNQPMRWLQIRVSDTGCGVEDKVACFEPFVSGRASVGLGLYLVKQHCMVLGGSCGVTDSSLGESGASFWIRVPIDKRTCSRGSQPGWLNSLHKRPSGSAEGAQARNSQQFYSFAK